MVYELTAGDKPSTVHWKAEKVVNGRNELMGELDLEYEASEACWKAEFSSPQVRVAWCLAVDVKHLTGTGRLLPGKQIVRRVDAVKD